MKMSVHAAAFEPSGHVCIMPVPEGRMKNRQVCVCVWEIGKIPGRGVCDGGKARELAVKGFPGVCSCVVGFEASKVVCVIVFFLWDGVLFIS